MPPTSELVLIGGKEESIRTWALDHPDHLGSDPGPAPHQPRDIGAVTCLQAPIFPAVKREEDYLPQVRREGACVISWTGRTVFYRYCSPVRTLLQPGVCNPGFGSPRTSRNYEQNCESVPFSEEALELSPNS